MKSCFKTIWPVLLLAIFVLFAFPTKTGLKADPAVYSTIARNVLETYQWWPLKFSPHMFPNFYEHPPLVLWMMALVAKVVGISDWSSSLVSKLCAILSLLGIVFIFTKNFRTQVSNSDNFIAGASTLGIALTLSWVPWVKYVGSAQFEGPLSFILVCAFFVTLDFFNRDKPQAKRVFIGFLVGLMGFMIKGIIFFPILLTPLFFSLFAKKYKRGFFLSLAFITGWVGGALVMYWLDSHTGTSWSETYWHRILGWGFQNSNTFDPTKGISFSRSLLLSWDMLKMEFRMSPIWTPFFWLSFIYVIVRKRNLLFENQILTLSFIFYWSFLAPFMISTIKMPHWPVPIYPIAALGIVSLFPTKTLQQIGSLISTRNYTVYSALFVAFVLTMVPLPFSKSSNLDRGAEWLFHQKVLLENRNPKNPLKYIKDEDPLYKAVAYSAWYLGPDYPVKFETISEILASACTQGGYLLLRETDFEQNSDQLLVAGWQPATQQTKNFKLMQCF
jgi:4-amino-4-deoxy-L-arabinose transferase-like glycosyltransferase